MQFIRTAAVLQLLLGNIGRPGGGIMALRGHANIQGATDIATLYDLLPGYLPMPSVHRDEQTLAAYLKTNTKPTGWWANMPKYVVSLLKAFYGDAATEENDYCFEYLPQLTGDHSMLPTTFAMKDGSVKGYFVIGQNPGASGQNAELVKAAMERCELVRQHRSLRQRNGLVLATRRRRSVEDRDGSLLSCRLQRCSKKKAR